MKIVSVTDTGFILTVPVVAPKSSEGKAKGSKALKQDLSSLCQGSLVSGVIKSMKG